MHTHTHRSTIAPLAAKAALALCCLVLVAGVGGAVAYFTDTDTAVNRFTVVPSLDITVVEEQWDQHPDEDGNGIPDLAEELVPGQSVIKDPAIENSAGTQAWIFAEVSVPTYAVLLSEADGELSSSPLLCELFSYTCNEGWTEIEEASYDAETNVTVHRYVWESPIDPGERTGTIFDSVTFANVADNQLDDLREGELIAFRIDINGIGIQTETFASWADAWAAYAG